MGFKIWMQSLSCLFSKLVSKSLSLLFLKKICNLDFDDDLEALEKALLETDQRIKKLEDHKESVNKEIIDNKSDKTIAETLRRLERNLDNLHKKRAFLIKERDSKSLSF